MNLQSKKSIFLLTMWIAFFLIVVAISPAQAQEGDSRQTAASADKPSFALPFADPSGPDTWLIAQPYGNTTGAYFQRYTTYGASGGIHFGVDLSAPCGTEIIAISAPAKAAVSSRQPTKPSPWPSPTMTGASRPTGTKLRS